MASSVALLVAPDGKPLLELSVRCDGVPCPALPPLPADPSAATAPDSDSTTVRFVAPRAGRISVVLLNGGVPNATWLGGVYFELTRGTRHPRGAWRHDGSAWRHDGGAWRHDGSAVNKINMLRLGQSVGVDVSGCTSVAAAWAAAAAWRLYVVPARFATPPTDLSVAKWRLVNLSPGERPVAVKTAVSEHVVALDPNARMRQVKERLEAIVGVPRGQQVVVAAPFGRCAVSDMEPLRALLGGKDMARQYPTLYVADRRRPEGKSVWFYVCCEDPDDGHVRWRGWRHTSDRCERRLMEARPSDSVQSVWRRVVDHHGLVELQLHGLRLGCAELAAHSALSDCGVMCLDTLVVAERGSLVLNVDVAGLGALTVKADPVELASEVKAKILYKLQHCYSSSKWKWVQQNAKTVKAMTRVYWDLYALYAEGTASPLEERRSLAEQGVTGTARLALRHWGSMQVPVDDGAEGLALWTSPGERVADVSRKVGEMKGVHPSRCRLLAQGRELDSDSLLRQAGVEPGSGSALTLQLVDSDLVTVVVCEFRTEGHKYVALDARKSAPWVEVKVLIEAKTGRPMHGDVRIRSGLEVYSWSPDRTQHMDTIDLFEPQDVPSIYNPPPPYLKVLAAITSEEAGAENGCVGELPDAAAVRGCGTVAQAPTPTQSSVFFHDDQRCNQALQFEVVIEAGLPLM